MHYQHSPRPWGAARYASEVVVILGVGECAKVRDGLRILASFHVALAGCVRAR